MSRKLTIGQLSRRTGAPVKTLRFYSNEGLLPPSGRSVRGYRLYTDEHALRVDLIRALREAGVGLPDVAKVLRGDISLEDVLQLRLVTVEAHIVGLQRIAEALRWAIRSGATEEHLRRVTMITRASNEERRQVVAAFYRKVAAGTAAPPEWIDGMIDASTARMPDVPSAEQLAAWMELCTMLEDPTFVACKRASADDAWGPSANFDGYIDAQHVAMVRASEARARRVSPASDEGRAIVETFASTLAAAAGKELASTRRHLRTKYDPRGARFWELVAVMKNEPPPCPFDDWSWLGEAFGHHVTA